MDARYLLDSNIIIYFLEGVLSPKAADFVTNALNELPQVSIISKIEILSWTPPETSNSHVLHSFLENSCIHPLNDSIVDKTIELRKHYKKLKLPDAIIAATALVHTLTLITRNENDFKAIQGLAWVNPFSA